MKTLLSKIRNNSTAREAVLVGGLLLFLAIPVSFSYFFGSDLEIDVPVDTESIEKLGQIYDQGGIESFKTAKKSLRKRVSLQLQREKSDAAKLAATHVALYLFPDLLPNNQLEKELAQNLFVPLQQNIEANPNTASAKSSFEELRANIWNFEAPNSEAPLLSPQANQMLKVYGGMSWK